MNVVELLTRSNNYSITNGMITELVNSGNEVVVESKLRKDYLVFEYGLDSNKIHLLSEVLADPSILGKEFILTELVVAEVYMKIRRNTPELVFLEVPSSEMIHHTKDLEQNLIDAKSLVEYYKSKCFDYKSEEEVQSTKISSLKKKVEELESISVWSFIKSKLKSKFVR